MKSLWSVFVSIGTKVTCQKKVTPSLSMCNMLLGSATLLLISACSTELSSEKGTPKKQKQQDVTAIEDNIKNSYARLASNHVDICPKLIQEDVDKNTVERTAEVMVVTVGQDSPWEEKAAKH